MRYENIQFYVSRKIHMKNLLPKGCVSVDLGGLVAGCLVGGL